MGILEKLHRAQRAKAVIKASGIIMAAATLGCDDSDILCVAIPSPIGGLETRLNVNIFFSEPALVVSPADSGAVGLLEISAFLAPGVFRDGPTDRCGNPNRARPVLDPTLTIMGFEIEPTTPESQQYFFGTELTSAEFAASQISVTPPLVAGVTPDTTSIMWFGIGRQNLDSIVLGADEDLELSIVQNATAPVPIPQNRNWNLSILGDSSAIAVSAVGQPPDTVVIANQLLPSGETLNATLNYTQSVFDERFNQEKLYAVDLNLNVQLGWTITTTTSTASPQRH